MFITPVSRYFTIVLLLMGITCLEVDGRRPRDKSRKRRTHEPPPLLSSPYPPSPALYNMTTTTTTTPSPTKKPFPARDNIQMGCQELKSKKYITDGFCISQRPISEVVCTGKCLPVSDLPWYATQIKVMSRLKALDYRCTDAVIKRKRIELLCENGDTRTYQIKVVKGCSCKRYQEYQNFTYLKQAAQTAEGGNVSQTDNKSQQSQSDRNADDISKSKRHRRKRQRSKDRRRRLRDKRRRANPVHISHVLFK